MTQFNNPSYGNASVPGNAPANVDVNMAIAGSPIDRVRWGPIIAGLFAALSALALLSVLGLAIGLSAYDRGDDARAFGIGAGIWGAISMLLAFFIGGWLAARSAAVRGHNNGLLNGALVWAVAIPLMLYLLSGGLARLADVSSNAASAAANNMNREQVDRVINASIQTTGGNNQTTTEDAKKASQRAAWGTLVSLLLGLGAAAAGGYVGARERYGDNLDRDDRNLTGRGTGAPAM